MALSLIAFDVNETLLDLSPIRASLESIFGSDPPSGEWFARLLHGSLVANALGQYRRFGDLAAETLINMAGTRGLLLRAEDAIEALAPMSSLPPHADVIPGVQRLAAAGRRMVALTNGDHEIATAQIRNAGLADYLERVISVDEVQVFKPDARVYRHAAELMGVPIADMALVAAHDWDCAGAMHAGAGAVFVKRPGAHWGLPTPPPGTQVSSLEELAVALGP